MYYAGSIAAWHKEHKYLKQKTHNMKKVSGTGWGADENFESYKVQYLLWISSTS